MDIVIEQVPEYPPEAVPEQVEPETTQIDPHEQPEAALPEPSPKRRGRPPGSRNKPKIIEQIPEEPIVLNEPEPEPEPEPAPKKARAPRKPRAAPKAQAPPPAPPAPVPQTPLQVAASMLEILRLEQAGRQFRRGELYRSWVK